MEREFRRCVIEAKERGQTVFLSSHQLAEVEAVCDRVAILRAGRLVEVDSIADLRRLRRTVVDVVLSDSTPLLDNIVGVSNIEHVDGSTPALQPVRTAGARAAGIGRGRRHGDHDARTDARGDLPRLLRR